MDEISEKDRETCVFLLNDKRIFMINILLILSAL